MKHVNLLVVGLFLSAGVWAAEAPAQAGSGSPAAYINQNIGFNVKGYKYKQSEYPCNVDKVLVDEITKRGKANGIDIQPVATADKIRNGVIPVVAIDIEQMVLGEQADRQFGVKTEGNLPKMQVTAAVVKGKEMVTSKQTCAIMLLSELAPANDPTDLGGAGVTMCSAMRRCIKDLSKDIVDWAGPQLR